MVLVLETLNCELCAPVPAPSITSSLLTSTCTVLVEGRWKVKRYMLHDIVQNQIPGRVVSRWSNSHTLQFWGCPGDISSLHWSYTDLVRPVIICHKASQSILISHLLLITLSCKRNLGLGFGCCTSPRERERRQTGEATERRGSVRSN